MIGAFYRHRQNGLLITIEQTEIQWLIRVQISPRAALGRDDKTGDALGVSLLPLQPEIHEEWQGHAAGFLAVAKVHIGFVQGL